MRAHNIEKVYRESLPSTAQMFSHMFCLHTLGRMLRFTLPRGYLSPLHRRRVLPLQHRRLSASQPYIHEVMGNTQYAYATPYLFPRFFFPVLSSENAAFSAMMVLTQEAIRPNMPRLIRRQVRRKQRDKGGRAGAGVRVRRSATVESMLGDRDA